MPSYLRLVGLAVAVILVLLAVVWGRRAGSRAVIVLLAGIGLLLFVVALAPDVVRPFQDFLGLGDAPVGRIITALLLAVALDFVLIFYLVAKTERNTQRMRRLIRSLSAAQVERGALGERLGGILVCIPAFNEEDSLPGVLAEIPQRVAALRRTCWSSTTHRVTGPVPWPRPVVHTS